MPKNMANHSSRKYPKPLCKCSHLEYVLLILLFTLQLKGWEHNCLLSNVRPFYFFALDKNCLMRPSFHSENTALSFFPLICALFAWGTLVLQHTDGLHGHLLLCSRSLYLVLFWGKNFGWCSLNELTAPCKNGSSLEEKKPKMVRKKSPRQLCSQPFN